MNDAVHLGAPGFPFPRYLLQLGKHRREKLDYDGRGYIGKHPQCHDTHAAQGAAAEQVEKAQQFVVTEQVVQLDLVDAGQGDVRDEPVERQDRQREQDLRPQIREAECVYGCLQQPGKSSPLGLGCHH